LTFVIIILPIILLLFVLLGIPFRRIMRVVVVLPRTIILLLLVPLGVLFRKIIVWRI